MGVDVERFYKYYDQNLYKSMNLKRATFFDKETFGVDRILPGFGTHYLGLSYPPDILAQIPISEAARKDLARLQEADVDYLPGLSVEEKKRKLKKISYSDFLLQYVKVDPEVVKIFQTATHGLYAVGIDAVSAENCHGMGYPGFKGMKLETREQGGGEREEPYIFHFPDGNASIARLLVRSLVPGAVPGSTMEDIVTARMNYARLDDANSAVRIRLNSTAVRARHLGDPQSATGVEVTYVRGGKAHKVRAEHCVLACYNMVIPYLCPEMSEKQKEALHYCVKIPLVYTNVQISNWESFQKLGLNSIYAPGSYFSACRSGFPCVDGRLSISKFSQRSPACCICCALRADPAWPARINTGPGAGNF